MFPENPNLATRSTNDGAGNLYSECHRRGELLVAGDQVSQTLSVLLSEALERWGEPALIGADRFKKSELLQHLNALDFAVDVVLQRPGL